MPTVVRGEWQQDDQGAVRSDGFSLHVDLDHYLNYVIAHCNDQLEASVAVPDVYSFPVGAPRFVDVEQDEYDTLVAAGGNLRKS